MGIGWRHFRHANVVGNLRSTAATSDGEATPRLRICPCRNHWDWNVDLSVAFGNWTSSKNWRFWLEHHFVMVDFPWPGMDSEGISETTSCKNLAKKDSHGTSVLSRAAVEVSNPGEHKLHGLHSLLPGYKGCRACEVCVVVWFLGGLRRSDFPQHMCWDACWIIA